MFSNAFKSVVPDGTKCSTNKFDICINGRCKVNSSGSGSGCGGSCDCGGASGSSSSSSSKYLEYVYIYTCMYVLKIVIVNVICENCVKTIATNANHLSITYVFSITLI